MFARTATVLALLALTTACSSGGGGGGAPGGHVTPPGSFKPASCEKDTEGAVATYANAGKVDRVNSGFFGKYYNLPDLEAVLDASPLATAIYGSKLGVDLTTVVAGEPSAQTEGLFAGAAAPRKPRKNCLSFSFLPDATEEQVELWNEKAKESGGTLQGLYYRENGKPNVIILRGTDRWTIVHELMHYNFDESRLARRQDTLNTLIGKRDRALTSYKKNFEAYKTGPYRRDLDLAAKDLDMMVKAQIQYAADRMLEEVAIESLLIDKWANGLLTNVSEQSAQSGVWYISHSKEIALQDFGQFEELFVQVETAANENVWPEIADQVKQTRGLVAALSARIDGMIAKVKEQTGVQEIPGQAGPEVRTIAAAYTAMTNPHVMMMANSPEDVAFRRDLRRLVQKFK